MRTIAEIKDNITADFMKNEEIARKYGFQTGADFSAHFSIVSLESLLFYIFACAAWVQENLFESYRQEIETRIEEIIPHRPKWYRDKVLKFMVDTLLQPDTDTFDTDGMTLDAIAGAMVVKHAVAAENADASILTIKVAGETGGKRCKLPAQTETQLAAYIAEFKDAGVRIDLVNLDPDIYNCEVDIYYNAMLLSENVKAACGKAITAYIENLPFNGEYTNMSLIDELQKVEGVKIAELKQATTTAHGISLLTPINARCVPEAGYFTAGTITINMIAHE